MNQTYEDAVLKVVMWWSDKSFRIRMNQDNGDKSQQGGLVSVLLNTVSITAQDGVTEEKIKKFESKLTELLMAEKDKQYRDLRLNKDYHPCKSLYDACEFAGIDSNCLPCKSCTNIDSNNRATAKYQYGGELVVL